MDIKIDKKVPMPIMKGNSSQRKYPFGKMKVGDSFYIEIERNKIASAASYYGIRNGVKFSLRLEGNGFRVWRVE